MDILLIIIPFILIIVSQSYINSSYKKYSIYDIKSKMNGYDATKKILESHGIDKKISVKKSRGYFN